MAFVAAVDEEVSTKLLSPGSLLAEARAFLVIALTGGIISFGFGLNDRSLATCANALHPMTQLSGCRSRINRRVLTFHCIIECSFLREVGNLKQLEFARPVRGIEVLLQPSLGFGISYSAPNAVAMLNQLLCDVRADEPVGARDQNLVEQA